MATNRKRVSRRRDAEIDPDLLAWFEDAAPRPVMLYFMQDGELQAAWDACRAVIVARWAESAPGTRPPLWWQFDAPEQRRRMSGRGTPCHEVMAHAPAYRLGIPSGWVDDYFIGRGVKADRFDPNDAPVFESQASFLKCHGLLIEGESKRLSPAAFNPEVLPSELWPTDCLTI